MLIQPEKGSFYRSCKRVLFKFYLYWCLFRAFLLSSIIATKKHLKSGTHFCRRIDDSLPPIGVIVRIIGIADIGFDLREKVKQIIHSEC